MLNSLSKKGRPTAYHRTSWGERIEGLAKLADGRWKVSGPKPVKFREPDERLAVARFREIEAKRKGAERVLVPVGTANVHEIGPLVKKALNPVVRVRIPRDHTKGVTVEHSYDTDEGWAWFRQQILTRPQYVAQRVGIEQIGYLHDIKKPSESPKLAELIDLYTAKPGMSTNEVSRSKLFWKEFTKAVGVATARQITHEHIATYEKTVVGSCSTVLITRTRSSAIFPKLASSASRAILSIPVTAASGSSVPSAASRSF